MMDLWTDIPSEARFGFKDIPSLLRWFPRHDAASLHRAGYVLAAYESETYVVGDSGQVMFIPADEAFAVTSLASALHLEES